MGRDGTVLALRRAAHYARPRVSTGPERLKFRERVIFPAAGRLANEMGYLYIWMGDFGSTLTVCAQGLQAIGDVKTLGKARAGTKIKVTAVD